MTKRTVKGLNGQAANGRMKIDGRCHCGKISYEAEINPDYVIICHCTDDCQTISGAPYRVTVPVKAENFKLHGQPKTYVNTANSGNRCVLGFCAAVQQSTQRHWKTVLFLACALGVKQRAQLIPKSRGWCRSALPWAMDIGHISAETRPNSIAVAIGTFETCRLRRPISEFEANRKTCACTEFFSV